MVMAEITAIPIPCWICAASFDAPATLTMLAPRYMPAVPGGYTSRQVSAHVWVHVDNTPIQAHLAEHWPVIVMLFYWWAGFVEITGFDPLEWYGQTI